MQIDGRPAQTGTIVIGAGQAAEISLPWGMFKLVFNPSGSPQNVQLTTNPNRIVFDGTDNALGLSSILTIPLANGQSATLNLAVYAIGEGASADRILHYTVG
jgi:hypothetical protein